MMIFLMILVSLICFCTGLIAGLFITFREVDMPKAIKEKRPTETTFEKELKNFFEYDGREQK